MRRPADSSRSMCRLCCLFYIVVLVNTMEMLALFLHSEELSVLRLLQAVISFAFAPATPFNTEQYFSMMSLTKKQAESEPSRSSILYDDSETSTDEDEMFAMTLNETMVSADEVPQQPHYYMVFSTSCSAQQNWQSYVFFYHAMKVKQPGSVVSIVGNNKDTMYTYSVLIVVSA